MNGVGEEKAGGTTIIRTCCVPYAFLSCIHGEAYLASNNPKKNETMVIAIFLVREQRQRDSEAGTCCTAASATVWSRRP